MHPSGALASKFLFNKKYFVPNNSKDSIFGKVGTVKEKIFQGIRISLYEAGIQITGLFD